MLTKAISLKRVLMPGLQPARWGGGREHAP